MYFFTSSIIQGSIFSPASAMGDLPPAAAAISALLPPGRDRGAADLVWAVLTTQPLRLTERLADLLEGVHVRDDLGEGVLPLVLLEEREAALDGPRVVLDHADDRLGPPDDRRGVELELVSRADVTDLEVSPAALQHLQTLGDDAREPNEVADDVGAPAAGEVLHRGH